MATCEIDDIVDCLDVEKLPGIDVHPAAILILTPFIVIFVWAAWIEFRRWWLSGPSENKRSNFPINEDAPSYEPPPEEDADSALPDQDNEQERRND